MRLVGDGDEAAAVAGDDNGRQPAEVGIAGTQLEPAAEHELSLRPQRRVGARETDRTIRELERPRDVSVAKTSRRSQCEEKESGRRARRGYASGSSDFRRSVAEM